MQGVPIRDGAATEMEPPAEVCKRHGSRSLVAVVPADEPVDLLGHELAHGCQSSGGKYPGLGDGLLVKLDGQVPLHAPKCT